jgi:hypothetical protein
MLPRFDPPSRELRPTVFGRPTRRAGAALERLKACCQLRWRRIGVVEVVLFAFLASVTSILVGVRSALTQL